MIRRLKVRLLLAAAACVVAASLSGCAVARSELGPTDGSCYVALPVATASVDHHGTLIGVRLVTVHSLRVPARDVFLAAQSGGRSVSRVCLVGYKGNFAAANVMRPRGHPMGKVAIVVVTYPGNRLLATVLTRHPPLRFGHSPLA